MTNAPPSSNPANLDSLVGCFREIFSKMTQYTDGMLPAQVVSYTAGPPARVQVQPLIQMKTTNNEIVSRPTIASIPVLQLGGGGFFLRFPIKPGDKGWIIAADRDITQFLQTYEQSPPTTLRKKKFSDALFIPDMMTGYSVMEEDDGRMTIQNLDGSVKVSIGTADIVISAPTVTIDSTIATNINSDTAVNMTAPNINMNATIRILENTPLVAAAGNVTATGTFIPGTPPT